MSVFWKIINLYLPKYKKTIDFPSDKIVTCSNKLIPFNANNK